MSVYKPFTPNNYSVVPFNANKQYDFNSASAASNKVTYHSSSWTSESIDLYNNGNIKYQQIDHLFYRNYFTNLGNKFGDINYLKHKRVLYNKANILSIPSGLYGHKIKKNSFFLSSSNVEVIDDSYGNLIISGTNVNDYITDPRSILLNVGPVKGFEKYDLDTYNDLYLNYYYRKGQTRVNSLYAAELFKNGTFTGVADTGSAINNPTTATWGPLITYTNATSASIKNEKLVITSNDTNMGARFDHSATEGTSYQFSTFVGEGDTGSIYIKHHGGGMLAGSNFIPPNTSVAFNYTAVNNNTIEIFFRANGNSTDGGTSSYDNISVKERGIGQYSTPLGSIEYDDSYFTNEIFYKNVLFSENNLFNNRHKFSGIDFNGYNSEVKLYHDSKFNFNSEDNFAIEFWTNIKNNSLNDEVHLIGKSTTKTVVASSGSSQFLTDINAELQYPFEIYVKNTKLYFRISDGSKTAEAFQTITPRVMQHVVCEVSSSVMKITINGSSTTFGNLNNFKQLQNNANIYIGNKGGNSNYFSGSLSQLKIHNSSLTELQKQNHYSSSNGSPYIGNIFYSNGLITITHPSHQGMLGSAIGIGSMIVDGDESDTNNPPGTFTIGGSNLLQGISGLQFQGSHLVYEHEYKCDIDEYEFNNTLNITTRKIKSNDSSDLANFTTGSLFKPYITTVGLYNENNELLVVGKLGQPIRTSNETDTTIVLRWDT